MFPTIVSIGEQLRGLQALVASARSDDQLLQRYGRLSDKLESLESTRLLRWTTEAASIQRPLNQDKIRIGIMDLRVASIALANNATLLSRNLRDFQKVPNLRVENWLD